MRSGTKTDLLLAITNTANWAGSDSPISLTTTNFTISGAVTTPPKVTTTTPSNGATNVAVDTAVTVNFSEAVDIDPGAVGVMCGATPYGTSTITLIGVTSITFYPPAHLPNSATCTVTVSASAITDSDSESLDGDSNGTGGDDYSFSFQTIAPVTVSKIHEIQGTGSAFTSPGPWTVEGIVTADYQTGSGGINGFFLQEEDGDADSDPNTSEAIFVYCNACPTDVSVGDRVRINGATASEYFNMTQLTASTAPLITITSSGNPLPTAVSLSLPVPTGIAKDAYLEPFEGMLVTLSGMPTVTEVYQLGRFGQVTLAPTRLYQFTHNNLPSVAGYTAHLEALAKNTIILDDGTNAQNPDPVVYPQGNLSMANSLRIGDTVSNVTGVLHYSWGGNAASPNAWRIRPTTPPTFATNNARSATPPSVGGNVKVASFNVLNYFNGNGSGGGFPTSRGASSASEFTRQRDKIINALVAINADVVGLMEIENDSGANQAVQDLVNGLNAQTAPGTYTYIDTGVIGSDEIRVAIIYKPGVVSPVGTYATLTNAAMQTDCNRPPLAQLFEVTDATNPSFGEQFTIIVNHLKSKGSACGSLGDSDAGDGQGNGYQARLNGANAIVSWLSDPYFSDPDVLLVGDMNAYPMESPIQAFVGAGFTDLIREFNGMTGYSYVFNGESSYLDHALASTTLLPQVAGTADWHINTDEPLALDYNVEFKSAGQQTSFYSNEPFRSSDHDPVIVGLNLGTVQPPALSATVTIDGIALNSASLTTVNAIRVIFDQDVRYSSPVDTSDDADNLANYRLIGEGSVPGIDTIIGTDFCSVGSIDAKDSNIPFTVSYDAPTRTVSLIIDASFAPLPIGTYRLVICGSTSIVSAVNGQALDGNNDGTGGDDATIPFNVVAVAGGGGNAGTPVTATTASLDTNNDGFVSQAEVLAGVTRLPSTGETPTWRTPLLVALGGGIAGLLVVAFWVFRRKRASN